jgi:hypothetical protein
VSFRGTFARWKRGDRPSEVHVGDPRFDGWEPVRDFEDRESAQAWREHLASAGFEAVLTADWPLDRFGRGDIALRVPPGQWSDAEAMLSNLDD